MNKIRSVTLLLTTLITALMLLTPLADITLADSEEIMTDYNTKSRINLNANATHTISVTAGTGGTISPGNHSAEITVEEGKNQTFSVKPDEGYVIDKVLVDGQPAPLNNGTYTFKNVTEDHKIEAYFKLLNETSTYLIKVSAGLGGYIYPNGSIPVAAGEDYTFIFAPYTGYEIDRLLIDDQIVNFTGDRYTLTNITDNHSIEITFKQAGSPTPSKTYSISATAGTGGSISPSGSVNVNAGDSKTFQISCDSGYEIQQVLVDNQVATLNNGTYTFSNVTANHTISVTFKKSDTPQDSYVITATAGTGGSITPSGTVNVEEGKNQTFSVKPDEGYVIDKVLVNGELVTISEDNQLTLRNISSNQSISVTFKESASEPIPSGSNDANNNMWYYAIVALVIIALVIIVYCFLNKRMKH